MGITVFELLLSSDLLLFATFPFLSFSNSTSKICAAIAFISKYHSSMIPAILLLEINQTFLNKVTINDVSFPSLQYYSTPNLRKICIYFRFLNIDQIFNNLNNKFQVFLKYPGLCQIAKFCLASRKTSGKHSSDHLNRKIPN